LIGAYDKDGKTLQELFKILKILKYQFNLSWLTYIRLI